MHYIVHRATSYYATILPLLVSLKKVHSSFVLLTFNRYSSLSFHSYLCFAYYTQVNTDRVMNECPPHISFKSTYCCVRSLSRAQSVSLKNEGIDLFLHVGGREMIIAIKNHKCLVLSKFAYYDNRCRFGEGLDSESSSSSSESPS